MKKTRNEWKELRGKIIFLLAILAFLIIVGGYFFFMFVFFPNQIQ